MCHYTKEKARERNVTGLDKIDRDDFVVLDGERRREGKKGKGRERKGAKGRN